MPGRNFDGAFLARFGDDLSRLVLPLSVDSSTDVLPLAKAAGEHLRRHLGIRQRREGKSFSRRWRILFEIRDDRSYLLDVGQATISPVASAVAVDATMRTNLSSLAALSEGTLDPASPKPGQVCLLTGDRQAWVELSAVLLRR